MKTEREKDVAALTGLVKDHVLNNLASSHASFEALSMIQTSANLRSDISQDEVNGARAWMERVSKIRETRQKDIEVMKKTVILIGTKKDR